MNGGMARGHRSCHKKPLNYISFDSIIHVFMYLFDIFILYLVMFICIYSVFSHFNLYLYIWGRPHTWDLVQWFVRR